MRSDRVRGFRVDHEVISKERSTSVRSNLRKFRHVKEEERERGLIGLPWGTP